MLWDTLYTLDVFGACVNCIFKIEANEGNALLKLTENIRRSAGILWYLCWKLLQRSCFLTDSKQPYLKNIIIYVKKWRASLFQFPMLKLFYKYFVILLIRHYM